MPRSLTVCLLCAALACVAPPAHAAVQTWHAEEQTWWPVAVGPRVSVVHGASDSLVEIGGSVAWVFGGPSHGTGGYGSLGVSGGWLSNVSRRAEGPRGTGFSVGPELRVGWAWGTWRRTASIYVAVRPYFLHLASDAGGRLDGVGGRLALGGMFDPLHLMPKHGVGAYVYPNVLELVVDVSGGGPFDLAGRVGLTLGWEW